MAYLRCFTFAFFRFGVIFLALPDVLWDFLAARAHDERLAVVLLGEVFGEGLQT